MFDRDGLRISAPPGALGMAPLTNQDLPLGRNVRDRGALL